MPVTNIPDDHHVVRHCKKRNTIRENGIVIAIHPDAFRLRPPTKERPKPETYLSAVYYEYFGGQPKQMKACCGALPFAPKKLDAIARLNVQKIKATFQNKRVAIRVTSEPDGHSPSYAAIRPGKLDDGLAAILASDAVVEIKEVHQL
jgi:hypothetical protein